MSSKLLYYTCVNEFKRQYFKDLLTQEHLKGGEVRINKLSFPDKGVDEEANFWGYVFEKNGIKYLLQSPSNTGKDLDITKRLPFLAGNLQKVAYNSNVYWLINKVTPARFRSEKRMTFRTMVDHLSSLEHTNPAHQKLSVFLALTSMMDRLYFRYSSPPSFGKDSIVSIMGCLFGNAATVENPTIAKLEHMTFYKWLVVNEVVDIKSSDWKTIEQFLLSAGAYKPEITKHSRAKDGGKEILDISDFSLSLAYNDLTDYPDPKSYFDLVTKKAVLDRFPAFRIHGKITEDFNSLRDEDVVKLVADNMEWYKDIIYTFTYFKDNMLKELHGYYTTKLVRVPPRWALSIGKLLRTIDIYCESQEEFDQWVEIVNDTIRDYSAMLEHPDMLLKAFNKLITPSRIKELKDSMLLEPSFSKKNKIIEEYLNDRKETRDSSIGLWDGKV